MEQEVQQVPSYRPPHPGARPQAGPLTQADVSARVRFNGWAPLAASASGLTLPVQPPQTWHDVATAGRAGSLPRALHPLQFSPRLLPVPGFNVSSKGKREAGTASKPSRTTYAPSLGGPRPQVWTPVSLWVPSCCLPLPCKPEPPDKVLGAAACPPAPPARPPSGRPA